jgi:L-asparaginase
LRTWKTLVVESRHTKAFVFEAFGSGNIPILDDRILKAIERAQKLKKLVAIATQCPHGVVDLKRYECGERALHAGAISAGDMTAQTSVVKLMHGLGQGMSNKDLKAYFSRNVAGERI